MIPLDAATADRRQGIILSETFNRLRAAATAFARAEAAATTYVADHGERARLQREYHAAGKTLEQASDLHAARGDETLADLIIAGHTIASAKRVFKLREQKRKEKSKAGRKPKAMSAAEEAESIMAFIGAGESPKSKGKARKPATLTNTISGAMTSKVKTGRSGIDKIAGKASRRG